MRSTRAILNSVTRKHPLGATSCAFALRVALPISRALAIAKLTWLLMGNPVRRRCEYYITDVDPLLPLPTVGFAVSNLEEMIQRDNEAGSATTLIGRSNGV
jgi:hypothetical protein